MGTKRKISPKKEQVQTELQDMLNILQQYYGQKPIIYAPDKSYRMYLAGDFPENDIWIRSALSKPRLEDGRDRTFWQYSNRERLKGYHGGSDYIDMNVFCGMEQEFDKWLQENNK